MSDLFKKLLTFDSIVIILAAGLFVLATARIIVELVEGK